jgi:hypothetical protein
LQIQGFIDKEIKKISNDTSKCLNSEQLLNYIDLVKPWMDLTPDVPRQNFLSCYGILNIKQNFYTVCDMIEDYQLLEFQKKGSVEIETSKPKKGRNSMNLYDFVSSMELGNLSHSRQIPELYV